MSGGFSVNVAKPENAYRQKGFRDGERDVEPHPPDDPALARAYMSSYRRGAERRSRAAQSS